MDGLWRRVSDRSRRELHDRSGRGHRPRRFHIHAPAPHRTGDGSLLRRRAMAALASDAFRVAVSIDDAGPDRGPLSDRGERRGDRPILPGRDERDDDDGRASVSAFARHDEGQALVLIAIGMTFALLAAAIAIDWTYGLAQRRVMQ